MTAWTFSWMVSAALGGLLIEHFGYTFTINITISIYVFSSIMFYYLFKDIEMMEGGTKRWSIICEDID
jgi:predicted MFS family arabinose efflux permease